MHYIPFKYRSRKDQIRQFWVLKLAVKNFRYLPTYLFACLASCVLIAFKTTKFHFMMIVTTRDVNILTQLCTIRVSATT